MGELLLSFSGRLNRQPYWVINLAMIATVFVILVLVAVLGGNAVLAEFSPFGAALLHFIIGLFPAWINLATTVRRLHDRNKSAWWLLVFYLLPSVLQGISEKTGELGIVLNIAGVTIWIWAVFELGVLRGTVGPNRYGPDPLETRM
jgi:uncharacterized membrane protein YhaH (DUF805 family)